MPNPFSLFFRLADWLIRFEFRIYSRLTPFCATLALGLLGFLVMESFAILLLFTTEYLLTHGPRLVWSMQGFLLATHILSMVVQGYILTRFLNLVILGRSLMRATAT